MKNVLFLVVIFPCFLFAQTPLLISSENQPSTIIQSETSVFNLNDSVKAAVWKDLRNGTTGFYAQLFQSNGELIGSNFKVKGIAGFKEVLPGAILNLGYNSSSYFDGSSHQYSAAVYDTDGNFIAEFYYASQILGWCGTGYLGMFTDVLVADDCFVTFACLNGSLTRRMFDYDGNFIEEPTQDYSEHISDYATLSDAAINSEGVYLNAYYESDYTSDSYTFDFKIDVYDSDHSKIDSISGSAVPEGDMYLFFSELYGNFTEILVKPDGSFIVIWLDPSENKFYFNEYTISEGWDESNKRELFVNKKNFSNIDYINNFNFSEYTDGGFYFFFGYETSHYPNPRKSFNGFYKLDENLTPLDSTITENGITKWLGSNLTLDDNRNIFTGLTRNDDAYLGVIENFNPNSIAKLNDDQSGANQLQPIVTYIENNEFFITWMDEVKNAGILVDAHNTPVTEEKTLEGRRVINLQSGYKLNTWEYGGFSDPKAVGFNVYDENWNLLKEVLLDTTSAERYNIYDFEIFRDFVMAAVMKDDSLKIFKLDSQGNIISSMMNSYSGNSAYMKLWNVGDTVLVIDKIGPELYYDVNLQKIQKEYLIPYGAEFILAPDRIVSIYESYSDFGTETASLAIYSLTGDTLFIDEQIIGWKAYETSQKINDEEFLIAYKYAGNFYGNIYNSDGVLIREEILLGPNNNNPKKDLAISLSENKVRFAWAEAQVPGEGYNIYSSLEDKSLITSVEESSINNVSTQYAVHQNYPNPFNPSTVITFTIPNGASINSTLKIYDALGQEIETLVNEKMQPGNYKIEFDGSRLSSGVYFYQLRSGNYTKTKKMVLIK